MKKVGIVVLFLLVAFIAQAAYLDVEPGTGGNTVRASDGDSAAWWIGAAASDGLWGRRAFGYDQVGVFNGATKDIYEATGTQTPVEDCVTIITTISGLISGLPYKVEVVYWSADTQNWNVRAGFALDSLTLFDRTGTLGTAGVKIEGTRDGDRDAYKALVGIATADVNGQIKVYIDDLPATGYATRTWYDGLLYEEYNVPSNPSPADGETDVALTTSILSFSPRVDPNNPIQEDPKIVSHKVYFDNDPNLADADDLIATLPKGTLQTAMPTLANDQTYYWRVDEYLNNGVTITGDVWNFSTPVSLPEITQQPSDARVFTTDPNAAFTVEFTSLNPATVTWYRNGAALVGTETDVTIVTDPYAYSKLIIDTPTLADEGKYYCVVGNQPGTLDDQTSPTCLLVIKQLLAEYNFNGTLTDTGDLAAEVGVSRAAAQVKTVSLADPNEMLATVVASPSYVSGISGQAISLNGAQFIDLDPNGYPKAGPLDTIGDVRGAGYEKQGFGRGMDQGSILCWVKPGSTGAIMLNANTGAVDLFGLTNDTANNARMVVRGRNWDDSYAEIGTASGPLNKPDFNLQDGYWHMIAATWDNNGGVKVYINGEQVAANSAASPEKYLPWERANLLGAGRTSTRHILNNFLTGAVDSLRIYNYEISADAIASEYKINNELGYAPCINHNFTGSVYNFANTGSSYCKIDLADFADFAGAWLADGLY